MKAKPCRYPGKGTIRERVRPLYPVDKILHMPLRVRQKCTTDRSLEHMVICPSHTRNLWRNGATLLSETSSDANSELMMLSFDFFQTDQFRDSHYD